MTRDSTSHSLLNQSSKEHHYKRWHRNIGLVIQLAPVLLALGIWYGGGWRSLEGAAYVGLFKARQASMPVNRWDDRIAVIAIDDLTLSKTQQFPVPRQTYVQLLSKLDSALPGAIVFDILFLDPSPDDAAFAQAISESWNVVLAIASAPKGNGDLAELVPSLSASAAALGHVNVSPDVDGIPRQLSLYYGSTPSLSIAALQVYEESLAATIGETEDNRAIATPYHRIPPSSLEENQAWINWPGPIQSSTSDCRVTDEPGELRTYPLICVLEGTIPINLFADKIVLIGATAQGLDPLYTPFHRSPAVSNVYLHAALINNLLNDQLLRRMPSWLEKVMLLGFGLLTIMMLQQLNLLGRIGVIASFPLLWFGIAVLGLQASWLLPVAAPIGVLLLAFLGVQGREQWEKQQLMNLFQVYVSTDTAQRILSHKEQVLTQSSLPVETLMATVLFVDIREFTHVAEHLPPPKLMEWLNRYFSSMTACITAHGGTVDKYIGDEIMAVFMPSDQEMESIRQTALSAIAASFDMLTSLQKLNEELQFEELPTIEFGIGIHTGHVAAGNVGSVARLNYSVVGDAVNVASRLQSINKIVLDHNPHNILVSQETYRYVGAHYVGYSIGKIPLRGRQRKVLAYSILQPLPSTA
ncbi:MAG: adenylate/guanylate cyclase domain-containing protein [Cyanobacteria bacterium P01_E01_bin.6]